MSEKTSVWERTSVQYLLRNRQSGRYYGRWKIAGKQKWVSLDTDVFGVAKLRLRDEAAKIDGMRTNRANLAAGDCTMAELMVLHEERLKSDPDLKPTSIAARLVGLKKVQKTWPGIGTLKPSQITAALVQEWAKRFKDEGTAFTAPGSKTVIRGNSAGSVNRAIDSLRRVLDIGVERGAIHSNPARVTPTSGRLKKKVTTKKPVLPSFKDLQRLFTAIEDNGAVGGWGAEAADFCRFLAFSGCRVGEMEHVTWGCVKWERGEIQIKGQKTEKSDRILPLFADLSSLLGKVIERRTQAAVFPENGRQPLEPGDRIFRIGECQKSIDSACKRLQIARITHHDLRHLFATRCIESGVDIPTVSRWLGHADGGALAMRTYGHLRDEHSAAQAAKVTFVG